MTTFDRKYEYRADFDGHEFAGFITADSITDAASKLERGDPYQNVTVDVRFLAEVERTSCCQRGDWSGAEHQPASAFIYVPTVYSFPRPRVVILPETTDDYRWECEYCGRIGTRAELTTLPLSVKVPV